MADGDGDGDGDADADGDGDADSDGDEEFAITSVVPGWGYTTGFENDPRPQAERLVDLHFTGDVLGSELVVTFDGQPLESGCPASPPEAGCVQLIDANDGLITIRYPASRQAGEVEVELSDGSRTVVWTEPFVYRLLELDFEAQSFEVGGEGAARAVQQGCFRDRFDCTAGSSDIAVIAYSPATGGVGGMVRLLSSADDGSRRANLSSAWSGPTAHAPLLDADALLMKNVSPILGPEALVTVGNDTDWSLQVSTFDRDANAFIPDDQIRCFNPPPDMVGVVAGDFSELERGDEVVVLTRSETSLGLRVHLTSRQSCYPSVSVTASVEVGALGAGAPSKLYATAVDLDQDDNLDVALSSQDSLGAPTLFVFWGDGAGGFDEPTAKALPADCGWPGQTGSGDFTGDGIDDLLIGCSEDNQILLVAHQGDRTFGEPLSVPVGEWIAGAPMRLAVGDLDSDAISDVAVFSPGDRELTLFQGTGDVEHPEGPFVERRMGKTIPSTLFYDLVITDVDGEDNDLDQRFGDLVIAGEAIDPEDDSLLVSHITVIWTSVNLD